MATITGTAGSDRLYGTLGDDVIVTGGGADTIDAGAGDDVVRLTGPVPEGNQVANIIDGGIGHDILDLTGWVGNLSDHDVGGFLGFNELSADGTHLNWVGYVRNFEEVHLGPGVQSFSAYQESGANPATIPGWTIIGSNGPDNIIGSRAYDDIRTGDGNDSVQFMGGSDHVSLGNGDDMFSVMLVTGYHDHVQLDGGAGTDMLDIQQTALDPHTTIDLEAGTGQLGSTSLMLTGIENIGIDGNSVPPRPGWTMVLAGAEDANNIRAEGGADTVLLGRGGNDALQGFELTGNLTAFGGSGNDTVYGGSGADWINGDGHYAGDTVSADGANGGADYIDGGDGNDHIFGNSQFAALGSVDGADRIFGGGGADYINGNAGDDAIFGGDGSDGLYGGAGNDSINGDAGNDHINGNKGDDTIDGGSGNDELLGGQGNDVLFGGNGNGDGNDTLSGGLGDDALYGRDGNDMIQGGDGNDRINGGDGIDTLSGGAGSDIFIIYGSNFTLTGPQAGQTDVITDFHDGQDKLDFVSSVTMLYHPGSAADFAAAVALAQSVFSPAGGGDVAAVQVGADTYLFFGNGGHGPEDAVCLTNVSAALIDGNDLVF